MPHAPINVLLTSDFKQFTYVELQLFLWVEIMVAISPKIEQHLNETAPGIYGVYLYASGHPRVQTWLQNPKRYPSRV